MTETTGSGGLSALALGGIGATVVVVGGAVMVWLGVFEAGTDRVLSSGQTAEVTITPSTENPGSVEGTSLQSDQDAATDVRPAPVVSDTGVASSAQKPTSGTNAVQENADAVSQRAVTPDTSDEAAGTQIGGTNDGDAASDAVTVSSDPAVSAAATNDAVVEHDPATIETLPGAVTSDGSLQAEANQTAAAATPDQDQDADDLSLRADSSDESAIGETGILAPPQLDLVRVDPTGETVIAGRAFAGTQVSVLLDGEVLEQIEIEAGGEFVAFASIAPSHLARVISLRTTVDGQEILSESSFILAPAAPVPAVIELAQNTVATDAAEPDSSAKATSSAANGDTSDAVAKTSTDENHAMVVSEHTGGDEAVRDTLSATAQAVSDSTAQTSVQTTSTQAIEPASVTDRVEAAPTPSDPVQQPDATALDETETSAVQTAAQQPAATNSGAVEQSADAQTGSAPQPKPAQVAVLRADAGGVTLVQPAAQAPLNKVVLDTISYSDSGEVQIAGRAGADTEVRAYLNNAPVASFAVAANGSWGGRLEAVEPGVYHLRLDAVEASGKVVSRLETPFKREAPEVLQPPAGSDTAPDGAAPLVRAVTVQKGDTLWAISQQRYGSGFLYVRVFEANTAAIRDPDLIYPGQVFTIPE